LAKAGALTSLRRAARIYAPESLRLAVALARRRLRDSVSGDARRLVVRANAPVPAMPLVIELAQPVRQTAFFAGKLENIRLGAARLDGITIAPGEIFSFWALVGRPSARSGFAVGRSIRGGEIEGDVGGGLCQLSGIAYQVGLRGGLAPLERHPHSRDLYSEEERFTPLGLDATVVWPYKDLRLANNFGVPVMLSFSLDGMSLSASLRAGRPIEPMVLEIDRVDHPERREVRVSRGGMTISHDSYAAT
jgi:vancomycin resistance protein VanW